MNIGEVIAIIGTEITIRAFENSNLETHFFNGKRYKGVSIREFIAIDHGFREIICLIEGEYLDERCIEKNETKPTYIRKLKARPLGYFSDGKFRDGIKFLPKIGDKAKLLSDKEIGLVFEKNTNDEFVIGSLLKEGVRISLPWQALFNTHLGIFGNTGSGKSNTLTKLFTSLFEKKITQINGKSKFIILDFNGEYTSEQLASNEYKKIVQLKNGTSDGDKYEISEDHFWESETLSILFQATANTQKPFLQRVLSGRKKYLTVQNSFRNYISSTYKRVLRSAEPKTEALELLKYLTKILPNAENLFDIINKVGRRRGNDVDSFHIIENSVWKYLQNDSTYYDSTFQTKIDALNLNNIHGFYELQIRANLQIINDTLYGSVHYEHIHPFLRRIDSFKDELSEVISVTNEDNNNEAIVVYSFRNCKSFVKKIIPILIAKHYFDNHKNNLQSPPNRTLHFIIDEAHNILSLQSNRETESWKDYRLELFEEIIKEGRKFGIYITISSQRPADISATIVSQLHNYFIHRLVNDRDIKLLENTISTLDSMSRNQIPSLPQGACVVTGTAFDIPMLIQVDRLDANKEPDSSDVNLTALWQ